MYISWIQQAKFEYEQCSNRINEVNLSLFLTKKKVPKMYGPFYIWNLTNPVMSNMNILLKKTPLSLMFETA